MIDKRLKHNIDDTNIISSNRISQIRKILANVNQSDSKEIILQVKSLLSKLEPSEIENEKIEELVTEIKVIINGTIKKIAQDHFDSLMMQIRTILENINGNTLENILIDIQNVLKYTNSTDESKIDYELDYTKNKVVIAVEKQEKTQKGLKKKKLKGFINNYIAELNTDELMELINLVDFYEQIMENVNSELTIENVIIGDVESKPLNERMEKLLIKGALIPEFTNEKQFTEEMYNLMIRLQNYIEKRAKKSGFTIKNIPAGILLENMEDTDESSFFMTTGVQIDSYLNSVSFTASLPELHTLQEGPNVQEDMLDYMKYLLSFSFEGDEGVTREDLEDYLEKNASFVGGSSYVLSGNDHIQIKAHLYNKEIYVDNENNGRTHEKVTLEIFVQPKKAKLPSAHFLQIGIPALSRETQELVNQIYNEFGSPELPFTFDMNHLLDNRWDDEDLTDQYQSEIGGIALYGKSTTNNSHKKSSTINHNNDLPTIILEENEMHELTQLTDILNDPEHYEEDGNDMPKGTTLYGPAGTGKTLFASHVANNIDGEFMVIKCTEIVDKWEGNSEKAIQAKIDEAKAKVKNGNKVIMFFDEADALFPKRTDGKEGNKDALISVLLQEMDGINKDSLKGVFIFFATNRLSSISTALLSRFNKKIELKVPSYEKRIEHFKSNIENKIKRSKNNNYEDIDYELLAKKTDKKSGRFISLLINNANLKFSYNRKHNPDGYKLISTQNILDCIKITEQEEKDNSGYGGNGVGFMKD